MPRRFMIHTKHILFHTRLLMEMHFCSPCCICNSLPLTWIFSCDDGDLFLKTTSFSLTNKYGNLGANNKDEHPLTFTMMWQRICVVIVRKGPNRTPFHFFFGYIKTLNFDLV